MAIPARHGDETRSLEINLETQSARVVFPAGLNTLHTKNRIDPAETCNTFRENITRHVDLLSFHRPAIILSICMSLFELLFHF